MRAGSFDFGWISLVIACFLLFAPGFERAEGIVRRDDIEDQLYIDFGADFTAVGQLTFGGSIRGSGSLIHQPGATASEWVLTAAHLATPDEFVIDGTAYGVSEFIRHPGWGGTNGGGPPATGVEYDIALARLAQPVTGITPLFWHHDDGDIVTGLDVVSVGMGRSGTGETGEVSGTAGTRRAAENRLSSIGSPSPVTPPQTAFEYLFNAPGDAGVMDLEGMAVLYDSGGPVLADFGDGMVIVGVHSYVVNAGGSRGTYGDITGSTRVTLYNDWITQTIPEPSAALWLTGALTVMAGFSRRYRHRKGETC